MNKTEFLTELDKRLRFIPADDRQDAIEYYDEYIMDMGIQEGEDVVAKLGTPKDVAKDIIEQCTQKHIVEYEEKKTVKSKATVIWLTILGILSLPVSLPIGFAILVVAVTLIFTAIVVIVSLIISMLSFVAGGLSAVFAGLFAPGIAQKLFSIGTGLVMTGLGILGTYGLIALVRKIFNGIFDRKKREGGEIL